ncbi:MAG: ubiquinone/menaquinone biosynthesis methyltransferase [Oligoflexia bacterium]|nr:ubiquinone/menaquinone biosynthesis methyltransferase [Oligoflexia bacterium]MBF0366552.1 ubiquinone/menaquinone biosynthesis methyltransferase [Oligoflexia bacterium]
MHMKSKEHKLATITKMFNDLAPKYDLLNRILSMRMDVWWRRRLVSLLEKQAREQGQGVMRVLDVAAGTGDLSLMIARSHALESGEVVAIDPAKEMLAIAKIKYKRAKLPTAKITFQEGNAELLPFEAGCFGAATVAFGVRNFEDLEGAITEIYRVLSKGGTLFVLEFSWGNVHNLLTRKLLRFYFQRVMLPVSEFFSGQKSSYSYLANSIFEFPAGERFLHLLGKRGFGKLEEHKMCWGLVTIYIGVK